MASRQDIPDNQFDEIFRKAADNYRPDFNAFAWRKMEKKLDWYYGTSGLHPGKSLITFFIVLLLDMLMSLPSGTPELINFQSLSEQPYLKQNKGSLNNEGGQGSAMVSRDSIKNEKGNLNQITHESSQADNPSEGGETIPENNINDELTASREHQKRFGKGRIKVNENISRVTSQPFEGLKANKFNSIPFSDSVKTVKNKIYDYYSRLRSPLEGLHVLAMVSPDFTSVGFMGQTSLGLNSCLMIEYEFINRLRFSVGLSRSGKKYAALEGYEPFPGFWDRVEKPEIIEGSCTVMDLSFNIRYDLIDREGFSIFLRPGVSSWLMETEAYDYIYGPEAQTEDFTYSPEDKYENKHWFGLVNLSVGYEHRLSKNWGLEINPFVQLPVKDIGAGKVRLQTKGTYLSFKYSF